MKNIELFGCHTKLCFSSVLLLLCSSPLLHSSVPPPRLFSSSTLLCSSVLLLCFFPMLCSSSFLLLCFSSLSPPLSPLFVSSARLLCFSSILFCSAPLFSFSGLLFSSVLFLCSALLLCSPPLLCSRALSTSCSVWLCLVKTRAIATARGRAKKTYFLNCENFTFLRSAPYNGDSKHKHREMKKIELFGCHTKLWVGRRFLEREIANTEKCLKLKSVCACLLF